MEVSVTAFVECANRLIHVPNASTLHSTICCRRLNHWHVLTSKRLQTCSKNKSIRATKASAPQHLSLLARLPCKGRCVQNKPALTFCVDFYVLLSVHPFRSWLSWKCDSCWVWMSRLEFGIWILDSAKKIWPLWKVSKGVPFLPFSVNTGLGLPKMVLPLTPLFGNSTCNGYCFRKETSWDVHVIMSMYLNATD